MKNQEKYAHKKILVVGLAKSGVSVSKLLHQVGAFVTVNDAKPMEENKEAQELLELGIKVITGSHPVELVEEEFDCVVKNPGIPYSNPMIERAIELGLPVFTEVEIAYQLMEGTAVGITGSNGKTTTTTLAQMMVEKAFQGERKTFAVGNIGLPLSSVVEESNASDIYITELSSFQLMGVQTYRPHIAVLTNIFSAHLDYHGSREAYIQAKLNLVRNQTADDYLVYNDDFPELLSLIQGETQAQLVPFSRQHKLEKGAYFDGKILYFNGEEVLSSKDIHVPGSQNIENILAALCVAKLLGAGNAAIQEAVREFKGVKHRTQYVKTLKGRRFYNDSKATNIVATQTALRSFDGESVVLIAGGLDRGNEFDELIPDLKGVRSLILYGESKDKLATAGRKAGIEQLQLVESLRQAVSEAYKGSGEGDIILFSPACASWDQYPNFEVRGDEFISLVEKLQ